jgi:hypothetical protein
LSVVILFAVIILSGLMVSATFYLVSSTLGITQRMWFFRNISAEFSNFGR